MAYSKDLRWRAVVLFFVYNFDVAQIGHVFGASARSILRWNQLFKKHDMVTGTRRRKRASRWPEAVCAFVLKYVRDHPCFYLDELQDTPRYKFGNIKLSTATICRALRFDLGLTRKVLTRRAREAKADQVQDYIDKLKPFYSAPEQLVFLDETAKDSRDGSRRYAWSKRNTPAVVTLPFVRGERNASPSSC
ncbi:hypothetical protein PC119_g25412 [Phytophthora cactorum]|nr:hypothetical protein PC119_g25412 [Phytophthora cactorum]